MKMWNVYTMEYSVQLFSHVQLFATLWTAACQASLSINNSRSSFKLMSIDSVMPSNHLILCHPILLLPSIFSSIRAFSNESVLHSRVLEFQLQHSPSNEYSHSRKPSHRWACGEFWNLRRQHSRGKKLKIHRIHA